MITTGAVFQSLEPSFVASGLIASAQSSKSLTTADRSAGGRTIALCATEKQPPPTFPGPGQTPLQSSAR